MNVLKVFETKVHSLASYWHSDARFSWPEDNDLTPCCRHCIFLTCSYSLFHIFAIKTSCYQLENFKRIGKKIGKNSVSPIIGFDCKDTK